MPRWRTMRRCARPQPSNFLMFLLLQSTTQVGHHEYQASDDSVDVSRLIRLHASAASASSKASRASASYTVAKKQGLLTTTHCVGTMSRVRLVLIIFVLL